MGKLTVSLLLFLTLGPSADSQQFDPSGTWSITTTSSGGGPMTVSFVVRDTGSEFSGRATTSQGTTMLSREITQHPDGFSTILDTGDGGLYVRIVRQSDGTFTGWWSQMTAPRTMAVGRSAQ